MTIMSLVFTSLLSLASAVIVAVLGHHFSAKRKRNDELAEMRLKAYADFIGAASRLAAARRIGQVLDEVVDLAALNDAKIRICVCGDSFVVGALVEFWRSGGTLEKEGEILAFANLCARMRESLGNEASEIQELNVADALFKLQPATYSYKNASSTPITA